MQCKRARERRTGGGRSSVWGPRSDSGSAKCGLEQDPAPSVPDRRPCMADATRRRSYPPARAPHTTRGRNVRGAPPHLFSPPGTPRSACFNSSPPAATAGRPHLPPRLALTRGRDHTCERASGRPTFSPRPPVCPFLPQNPPYSSLMAIAR